VYKLRINSFAFLLEDGFSVRGRDEMTIDSSKYKNLKKLEKRSFYRIQRLLDRHSIGGRG
jgi:hypothetical protein